MKQNKIKKVIVSIIIAIISILALTQKIYAAPESIKIKLSELRYLKTTDNAYESTGFGYLINNTNVKNIYQLLKVNDNDVPIGTNFYCVNAKVGNSWTGVGADITKPVEYNQNYDLKDRETIRTALSNNEIYNLADYEYYESIVWLFDNMYVPQVTDKDSFFAQMGIVKDTTENGIEYVYTGNESFARIKSYGYRDTSGNLQAVILPDELVEAVQQAVIWHFTNGIAGVAGTQDGAYNNYAVYDEDEGINKTTWLQYITDTNKMPDDMSNYTVEGTNGNNVGRMYNEQACILYNYLVDRALEAKEDGYTGEQSEGTISIDKSSSETIKDSSGNYKIGPLTINTTGRVSNIEITAQTSDGTDIQNIQVINEDGEEIATLIDGTEFYVTIPSNITEDITIIANATATNTVQKLWINETATEQPIVEITQEQKDITTEITITNDKVFDLSLRKIITQIKDKNGNIKSILNENGLDATRRITVDPSTIPDTARYYHRKDPVVVSEGDIITYQIIIYNEGDIDGYASTIIDQLPAGLETTIELNQTIQAKKSDGVNGNTFKLTSNDGNKLTLEQDGTSQNLSAYSGTGNTLDYEVLELECRVTQKADTSKHYLTNIAYINSAYSTRGAEIQDRENTESRPDQYPNYTAQQLNSTTPAYTGANGNQSIYNDTNNEYYYQGQEDDDDFETLVMLPKKFDLALRKFIGAISKDAAIEDGEYLTTDKTSQTTYTRAPLVDTSKLKTGEDTTAIYNHSKDPLRVEAQDYILYIIRVYNEGDIDGYASRVTDYLPEYLNYIDGEFNNSYGWVYNTENRSVTTTYLSSANGENNKLLAFDKENDDGEGSGLSYKDIPILCRISSGAVKEQNITNIAEITEYQDENGEIIDEDIDSTPGNLDYPEDVPGYEGNPDGENASDTYYPGQEDDDDFDRVIIDEQEFDLALRKFITNISGEDVTTRIPEVTYEDGKIVYTHPKDVVKVVVGDIVTYTIRVYNEGEIDGYAQTITDDIPEYLEFLPDNETNITYRWKMYNNDGQETTNVDEAVKIVTDYTSKEYGETMMAENTELTENPNLLNAFDPNSEISDTNPDYRDVRVTFRVLDPDSSKHIIRNEAQISEDADENGDPVEDIDSEPDEWNDGEDDQDYENVSVEYFDLALLKYVTEVEVTENGKTTTTKTGNTGDENDIIPKVEIHRKRIDSTIVKFTYTIKITNEGDIPGYATEITDYVPEGLEFYAEDNEGWEEAGDGVITTTQLSDTLLNPGESVTIKVTFRWINGEDNLGLKTNIAEISDDDNEKGIPDRDSTPGNKKDGEDDIDDADVLLSIQTGLAGNITAYISGGLLILLVLAGGVILIKKYVI